MFSKTKVFAKGFLSGTAASVTCYALYSVINYRSLEAKSQDYLTQDVKLLERSRAILKYGIPDRGPSIHAYNDHVVAYDQARKTPIWVAEHLNRDKLKGSANRKNSHFKSDPDIKKKFSADNKDYSRSGWSRGHMAPAGNYKYDQASMDDTFLLTNIVPQNMENNSGFWNRFEMYCRDLTKTYSDVRVITGPLMLPEMGKDGKLYVKYPVIGEGQVAVPTHLFKVIVAENDGQSSDRYIGAFIVPNIPINSTRKLREFEVDLDFLEMKTGVTFLPSLAQSRRTNLCKSDSCQIISEEMLELYNTGRRLQYAKNVKQVEAAWTELRAKKIEPDTYLVNLYQKRKSELVQKEKLKNEL